MGQLLVVVPQLYTQLVSVVTSTWCNCSPGSSQDWDNSQSIFGELRRLVRSRADPSFTDVSGLTAFVPASFDAASPPTECELTLRTCCDAAGFLMGKLSHCRALSLAITLRICASEVLQLANKTCLRLSPPASGDDGGTGSMHAAAGARK